MRKTSKVRKYAACKLQEKNAIKVVVAWQWEEVYHENQQKAQYAFFPLRHETAYGKVE